MDSKTEEKRLSDRNDEKILQKRDKEEETKKMTSLYTGETGVNEPKETKRKREPSLFSNKQKHAVKPKMRPGFKELPQKLKKHFPNDHVALLVKPDGTCGISCGAAHLFAQANKGKQFRREINKHMLANWAFYQNKVIFPYERQVGVGGDNVQFSAPIDFLNFLQTQEADLLWTDSEEIQAICNMYLMSASVVKVIGGEDDLPMISQVGPDKDILKLGLANSTLVSPGTVSQMHLLLEDAHYSLVVPRASINEKYASHPEKEDEKEDDGYEAEMDIEEEEVRPSAKNVSTDKKL